MSSARVGVNSPILGIRMSNPFAEDSLHDKLASELSILHLSSGISWMADVLEGLSSGSDPTCWGSLEVGGVTTFSYFIGEGACLLNE